MTVNVRKMATFPLLLELLTPFSVTEGNYKPTTGNWQVTEVIIRANCYQLESSVKIYIEKV